MLIMKRTEIYVGYNYLEIYTTKYKNCLKRTSACWRRGAACARWRLGEAERDRDGARARRLEPRLSFSLGQRRDHDNSARGVLKGDFLSFQRRVNSSKIDSDDASKAGKPSPGSGFRKRCCRIPTTAVNLGPCRPPREISCGNLQLHVVCCRQ